MSGGTKKAGSVRGIDRPKLHRAVVGWNGEDAAVAPEGHSIDDPFADTDWLPKGSRLTRVTDVPEPEGLIDTGCRENAPLRADHSREHITLVTGEDWPWELPKA
jgi:hypothetical protein